MSIPAVEESWARIEAWLARHAPVSRARLRPPAAGEEIRAAERELGLVFPPDLVASLRCHDGADHGEGAPEVAYYGPPARVADIVRHTAMLRDIGTDLGDVDGDEDELGAYWRQEWLLITLGADGQASDGLFLTVRPGPGHGRVGHSRTEDAPVFTPWSSLRHLLADFAEALEEGRPFAGRVPVGIDGALRWEDDRSVVSDPVSPLALAARSAEPEPPAPVEPAAPSAPAPTEDRGAGPRLTFVRVAPPRPQPLPDQPDLVFAEGLTPAELLRRLGAIHATVRPRSRPHAEHAAVSPWAAHRPMVRAGTTGGWAYAVQEEGAAQFVRPEVLRAVSEGTRAVALTRQGPEARRTVVVDGVPDEEAARLVMSPRENVASVPDRKLARRLGVDPWPGSTAAYARLLTELDGEFGIRYRPGDDAGTGLPSALLLPLLDDLPDPACGPAGEVRGFDLAALVDRTPFERLRRACAAQLRRLAAETGIDAYPEIADALARTGREEHLGPDAGEHLGPDDGERLGLDAGEHLGPDAATNFGLGVGDPLDLRIRTLAAETWAARQSVRGGTGPVGPEDLSAWIAREGAAQALRAFVLLPVPMAAERILGVRLSARWRDELATDLGEGGTQPAAGRVNS
ncbi:SMI1/KNR4 family protein [Streptomyces griseosporeus]|uniref:SMI1/KNR4 family protein n=1 Tax=Streptomyces griseosporeus TaxID=1910 RepID=UPI0037AE0F40